MRSLIFFASLSAPALTAVDVIAAQEPLPSIAEKTAGMDVRPGFLPLYWDADTGRLWLEVPAEGQELIYNVSLTTGLGSNDIGLDRGQQGGERIVRFDRVGRKVLLVAPNYGFRAGTTNEDEIRSVEEAFATSVLWGFEVAAQSDSRVLVDATDFVVRDAHGVIDRLKSRGQGSFSLDKSRSTVYPANTKGFPRNSEIEVSLTFTGSDPGGWVRSVAPDPNALTVRQRHSFIALPPPGYQPRRLDPRAGYFGVSFLDYAAPIEQPMRQRYIARHRLEKRDPSAPVSDAVEPIVYYLDRGTPEPVRSALLDGARWWAEAFEAIGYRNGYRVELLPEGADPMDIRYNVIQWVHRSTRGWSYGQSVSDPRTGEILKGHVLLGSLRVRQDYLIATGLLAPFADGAGAAGDQRMTEMALARLRQLSAHEVGHTIGLAHNFLASTRDRASVMDYPHPLVRLDPAGEVDLSQAYDSGIGEWDKVAVAYGYQDFPEGADEPAALGALLDSAFAAGLDFISDNDARPAGAAHPGSNLWDNGIDPVAELARTMTVRRAALDRFGAGVIREGDPWATMEEVLVPLYLHHRYQVDAAAKLVGGAEYSYALRGDGRPPVRRVTAERQYRAITAMLETISPDELMIPRTVLDSLPPRAYGYGAHRELFDRWTGPTFDVLAPAAAATAMTIDALLQPERAARMVEQHALDPDLPGLAQLVDSIVAHAFPASRSDDGYSAALERIVERGVADGLMRLADRAAMPQVRALAHYRLGLLQDLAGDRAVSAADEGDRAHFSMLQLDITRFLSREVEGVPGPGAPDLPPGSPIG